MNGKEFDQMLENTRFVGKVILIVFIVLSLVVATAVFGSSLIARSGSNYIRIFDTPCTTVSVIARFPPQIRAYLKAGEGMYAGVKQQICWVFDQNQIIAIWEDGDGSNMAIGHFVKEESD